MSIISIILIIILLAGYTAQSFFSKLYSVSYQGKQGCDTPVFSVFYGLIVGLGTLIYNGFSYSPDTFTLIIGILNGATLFFYNISYINSAKRGPYSFQSMMVAFGNIIIPLAFTLTYWGESIKVITIIGIICMLASFVVFNAKGFKFDDAKKGYWLWVILLCIFNGMYSEFVDAQTRHESGALREEMIITTFMTLAIISFIYLLVIQKGKLKPAFSIGKKAFVNALLSSVGAGIAINLLMIVLASVSSAILFPITGGGLLIINAFLGKFALKEKFDKFRIIGIALAAVSLVLVNL